MVSNNCSTEFWNILVEVYQILGLLMVDYIVEMDVLVSPFEVMDDPSVSQLFLDDKQTLEELDNMLIDVDMVVLSNESFL